MDFAAGQTLLFNKPKGWTSFDLVKKVRNLVRIKKVGHAGTLDPLATGLLIICTGKHTKTINQIQDEEKEYEVIFKLGATTPSYDAEFPEENIQDASGVSRLDIETAIEGFLGEIEQVPPIFSAVKVDGKRAYKAAREGKSLELKSRKVHIYEYALLDGNWEPPIFAAKIRCSKGTYIRSLIHDLGQNLGVGAYIKELKRTRIGSYQLVNAWEIEEFAAQFTKK
ncbi:MAG: tRNA pseudouridine(55) synthase TruB [Bacteroidetes bacterium]|nr:tRNA pseudouridine(55) synthase TruB [Bacteroidota bacterium]MCB0843013.1 tRNA pseudouridine(55) synthase TruB [Bacteroidota bacterium]MCB0851110.1 tRNA pseudouridine(55) synthase TruB [Bacteroidota bacterium]